MFQRPIPSSGDMLPVIGLGTWKTFDVKDNTTYPQLTEVLNTLHRSGGTLIDSSPMYGRAETVVGDLTLNMTNTHDFFYATKVWTTGKKEGIEQMESSMQKMKRETMDLMQIHNLTDWKTHLETLREWKEIGKIRYIGITHYMDSMHDELEQVIRSEQIDFVQFNYSIGDRHAENRLLPAAADHGVATLINRPFGEGRLFRQIKDQALPQWAVEAGMPTWGEFLLKFVIAHPAVTCVIPATSNPEHAATNFRAATGDLPDAGMLKKMREYIGV
jgi:diketogulonate reductase-like aldo/keto reductase